jgi:hypothetical protein
MASYTLFGRPGWGSTLVEAQLAGLGLPFDYAEVPDLLLQRGRGRQRRRPLRSGARPG